MLEHKHDKDCEYGGSFLHYLVEAAPNILWFNVQDVGSYQGSVYGIGLHKNKPFLYSDSYGSCSGCGAWGEGGEPTSEDEILGRAEFFSSMEELDLKLKALDKYNSPDIDELKKSAEEVFAFLEKKDAH